MSAATAVFRSLCLTVATDLARDPWRACLSLLFILSPGAGCPHKRGCHCSETACTAAKPCSPTHPTTPESLSVSAASGLTCWVRLQKRGRCRSIQRRVNQFAFRLSSRLATFLPRKKSGFGVYRLSPSLLRSSTTPAESHSRFDVKNPKKRVVGTNDGPPNNRHGAYRQSHTASWDIFLRRWTRFGRGLSEKNKNSDRSRNLGASVTLRRCAITNSDQNRGWDCNRWQRVVWMQRDW